MHTPGYAEDTKKGNPTCIDPEQSDLSDRALVSKLSPLCAYSCFWYICITVMIVCRIGQNKMAGGNYKQSYEALDTSFHEMATRGMCETCGCEFKTYSGLRRHVKTKHQPEKIYFVCNQCDKRYCTRQTLNAHLNKHKEGKTYKCEICGQIFTYLHNLTRHLKTHPVPQTYKCDSCQQEFSRRDNLMQHRRAIHELKAEHRCQICGASYRWTFSLRRHMKNKHANVN